MNTVPTCNGTRGSRRTGAVETAAEDYSTACEARIAEREDNYVRRARRINKADPEHVNGIRGNWQ